MTPETFWLGRGALVLVAGAFGTALLALFVRHDGPGRVLVARYLTRMDGRLRFVRSETPASRVLGTQALLAAACVAVTANGGSWLALLALPIIGVAPHALLEHRGARRITAVEAQLEAWLMAISNALRGSTSLGEAIASTSRLVPTPLSQEIDFLVREYELGTPLDEALQHFADRLPSKTVAGAVLAIKIARRSGGDLPRMLDNAGAALRELARLEGVVRSKTAEGKAQALVVGAIPVPLVLALHCGDPKYFAPLLQTFTGTLVIAGAAALWATAIVLSRKILAVDI